MKAECLAEGEPGRAVACAGEVEFPGPLFVQEVGDHRGVDIVTAVLAVWIGPQKSAALGRAEPLVTVAGVPVWCQLGQVDVDHAGSMGAVHQYGKSARSAALQQLFDW